MDMWNASEHDQQNKRNVINQRKGSNASSLFLSKPYFSHMKFKRLFVCSLW